MDQPALSAVLSAFAASVTDTFTTRTVLTRLAQAATEVLAVDGAAVMVADETSLLRFAHAHGPHQPTVAEAERLQELLQDGPCHDSHLTGRVINLDDLTTQGSWPLYQAKAAHLGLRGVTSIPLRARDRGWGVLDLYRSLPRRLDPHELTAAQTLADLATSYLVIAADREAADRAQLELTHRAMHDPLTDLPVRWVLLEQLTRSLARLARHHGHLAVLFVDLDGLKYVNDTYGHATGDDLLTACARRITQSLRPSDMLARVGGDEFVVLLEDLTGPTEASDIAHRVLARLASPLHAGPHTLTPSASIGLALTTDPTHSPETLIAHADAAMYRAKHGGRGRVDTLDATTYESDRAHATTPDHLLPALRAALPSGQLELHYQPIYETTRLSTDSTDRDAGGRGFRVHAVEALLRWRRPGHGLTTAEAFIGPAERTGLIRDLGAWVLHTACAQLQRWDSQLEELSPPRVFVNVSAVELADPALPARVHQHLRQHDLDPARLVLEVTETALVDDPAATTATVTALVDLGCSLAIDDFGTGYSSLRRLVDLPATTLKVDRSFTRDLGTSPAAAAVISAALHLGRTLERTVVVEGIEDQTTLDALDALGVTHVQGYHLARPTPAEHLTDLLAPVSAPTSAPTSTPGGPHHPHHRATPEQLHEAVDHRLRTPDPGPDRDRAGLTLRTLLSGYPSGYPRDTT